MFGFMEILESNTSRTTKAVCLTEKVKTLFIQADVINLLIFRGLNCTAAKTNLCINLNKMLKNLMR
jgi:hypothetical protein